MFNFDAVNKLDDHLSRIASVSTRISGKTGDSTVVTLLALHARILDLALALPPLLRSNSASAIYCVVRSQLEAYIDFTIIYDDPDHLKRMQREYVIARIDLLTAFRNPERRATVESFGPEPDSLAAELRELRRSEKSLASHGIERLGVKDRFARARKPALYELLYRSLCNHTHNNLEVLKLYLEREGPTVHAIVRPDATEADLPQAVSMSALMPTESVLLLVDALGRNSGQNPEELRASYESLQRDLLRQVPS